MAFIDFVEWTPQSNDVFAWRFPGDNLSTATQLVVRESQEALLFSKGQIVGKFGAGKHTLSTENLPVLRNLFGIPFGNKNPFTAEVWFVNKAAPLTIDWRTSPMRFVDPDYGQMIPLVAQGRYGLKVKDAERFLIKLVGTLAQFDTAALTDHFMGPLIAKTNSTIVSYMSGNRIGITQIAAHLDKLSEFLELPLKEFWEEYGMELTGFYITSVDIDTSTEDGRKISDALSDRSAQNIAGYTWQQKQSFGVAGDALSGGGSVGMLGALMMTGAIGNGGMAAQMMTPPMGTGGYPGIQGQPVQGQPAQGGLQRPQEVFCSNCAKKYPATAKFCPHCGDPFNPCPVCGNDNDTDAKRCTTCGAALTSAAPASDLCPRCSASVSPGAKFCPNCGAKIQ